MDMNKKLACNFLLTFILLFITSCVEDGENLEKCMRTVRIEPRWIHTRPVNESEDVNIRIRPNTSFGTSEEIKSDIFGVNVDLLTSGYTIVVWEDYSNVNLDITNQTVSVQSTSRSRAIADPSLFSAGSATAEVTPADGFEIIPLIMYRQVRPLIITIEFEGMGIPFINSINGTLNGIAWERTWQNGFPPVNEAIRPTVIQSGDITYTFTPSEEEGEENWYTGTRNLLGIDGNMQQMLDLNISFNNDNNDVDYEINITNQLAEFHTKDVDEPWYVILKLNLGANLEIDIVDWISGPESWITAQ